jgi:hypothetical protein
MRTADGVHAGIYDAQERWESVGTSASERLDRANRAKGTSARLARAGVISETEE